MKQIIDIFNDDHLDSSESQETAHCIGTEQLTARRDSENDPFIVDFLRNAEESGTTQNIVSQSSGVLKSGSRRQYRPMSIAEQSPNIAGKLLSCGAASRGKQTHPSTPLIRKRGAVKRTDLLSPLKRISTAVCVNVDPPSQSELENESDNGSESQSTERLSAFRKKLQINDQKSVLYFRPRKVFNLRSTHSYPEKNIDKAGQSVFTDKVYFGIYAIGQNNDDDENKNEEVSPNDRVKDKLKRRKKKSRKEEGKEITLSKVNLLDSCPKIDFPGDLCLEYPKVPLPLNFKRDSDVTKIFKGKSFLLSGFPKVKNFLSPLEETTVEKDFITFLTELIQSCGGTVIDKIDHQIAPVKNVVHSPLERTVKLKKAPLRTLKTPDCFLISDQPHLTFKYMTAIIFSVPLIHYNWVIHSVEEGTTLPFKPYALPAGIIDRVPYYVTTPTFAKTLFKGTTFCVIGDEKFSTRWQFLLKQMGAAVVAANNSKACTSATLFLAAPGSKLPAPCKNRIVSLEWVLSCVVTQQQLPPQARRK